MTTRNNLCRYSFTIPLIVTQTRLDKPHSITRPGQGHLYDSYGLGHAFDENGVNYYMLLASRLILLALCRAVI